MNAISVCTSELLDKIKHSWLQDSALVHLMHKLKQQAGIASKHTWQNGLLRKKGKLMVGSDPHLRLELIKYFHSSAEGGHSGMMATIKRLTAVLFWKGLRKQVHQFVRECEVCQRCKPDLSASPGLLQPLPVLDRIWPNISLYFIEGLPKVGGKEVILVVVDRLSKYAHFIALGHPFTALTVAQLFLDNIYRLHGIPTSIVSNRDKIFLNTFWKELFRLLGTELRMSFAYHPQFDGQTEVVNKCLETYLQCMMGECPKDSLKWLPLVEWWYNTNYHIAINTTPYQAIYGQPTPVICLIFQGTQWWKQLTGVCK